MDAEQKVDHVVSDSLSERVSRSILNRRICLDSGSFFALVFIADAGDVTKDVS